MTLNPSAPSSTINSINYNYNYQEPDIYAELMPIESEENFKRGLSPQDKYLSKHCLKQIIHYITNRIPSTSKVEQRKINKEKRKLVLETLKPILSDSNNIKRYADAYLIDYLGKTKEQQVNEAPVAFATLTSKWSKKNCRKLDSELPYNLGASVTTFINQYSLRSLKRFYSSDIEQHTSNLKLNYDVQKAIDFIKNKTNEIIDTLNVTNNNIIMGDAVMQGKYRESVKAHEDNLAKLQKEDLPKLNERIEDLEHASTHIIYGLNEEVQKLSKKCARLEANATDTYFINDDFKKQIADKDAKIVQLASKVDAFQEEIFEVKEINKKQANTIQELEERQMKMEEEQKRQRELLESLLKMQIQAEKKEQTAK